MLGCLPAPVQGRALPRRTLGARRRDGLSLAKLNFDSSWGHPCSCPERSVCCLCSLVQGDRRAGPSLAAYNYDSSWGQRALRETYRAIMGEERAPLALPQACRPGKPSPQLGARGGGCESAWEAWAPLELLLQAFTSRSSQPALS